MVLLTFSVLNNSKRERVELNYKIYSFVLNSRYSYGTQETLTTFLINSEVNKLDIDATDGCLEGAAGFSEPLQISPYQGNCVPNAPGRLHLTNTQPTTLN